MRSLRIGVLFGAALALAGCSSLATVQDGLTTARAGVEVANTATGIAAAELYRSCAELTVHVAALRAVWTTERGERITGAVSAALGDYCAAERPPADVISAARAVRSAVQAAKGARAVSGSG